MVTSYAMCLCMRVWAVIMCVFHKYKQWIDMNINVWDHSNWSKDRKNGARRMVDGEHVKEKEDVNPKIKQNVLIWKTDAPIHCFVRHIYGKSLQVDRKWNWKHIFSLLQNTNCKIKHLIMIYVYRMRQSKRNRGNCHLFPACYFCFMAVLLAFLDIYKDKIALKNHHFYGMNRFKRLINGLFWDVIVLNSIK